MVGWNVGQTVSLSAETLLAWLNRLAASNQQTFFTALFLVDQLPMLLSVLALVVLWFTGEPQADLHRPEQMTRQASRQRVLLIVLSIIVALIATRLLAHFFFRPPPPAALPFQASLEPPTEEWSILRCGTSLAEPTRFASNTKRLTSQLCTSPTTPLALKQESAFPSSHAALWFTLIAGLWFYHWKTGLAAGLTGLLFSLLRMAAGYAYPGDLIAGACVGMLALIGLFSCRQKLVWLANLTLQLFETLPALAYPLGLLILFDMTQRMAWLFGLSAILFGYS
jgi:membrane-associated phospholipid phosphatase